MASILNQSFLSKFQLKNYCSSLLRIFSVKLMWKSQKQLWYLVYTLVQSSVYCTDVTVLHIDHYKLIVKPFCYGQFSFFKTLFLCHVNRYKQNLFSQSELQTRKSKAYAANCSYSHYTYWLENDSSKMLKHIWCPI